MTNHVVSNTDVQVEKEANQLAMELLMPTEFVKEYVEYFKPDIMNEFDMKNMAAKFGVSETILTLRLKELGYLRTF